MCNDVLTIHESILSTNNNNYNENKNNFRKWYRFVIFSNQNAPFEWEENNVDNL